MDELGTTAFYTSMGDIREDEVTAVEIKITKNGKLQVEWGAELIRTEGKCWGPLDLDRFFAKTFSSNGILFTNEAEAIQAYNDKLEKQKIKL